MSWFSSLVSAVTSVARKAVQWVSEGIKAVAQFASKAIDTVKAGWDALKTQRASPATSAAQENDLPRRRAEALSLAAAADRRLVAEIARRQAISEADMRRAEALEAAARNAELERERRRVEQQAFLQSARDLEQDLRQVMNSEQPADFEEYARASLAEMIIKHLKKKAATLDGWCSLSPIELDAAYALPALAREGGSKTETAYHQEKMNAYCLEEFGKPLAVLAAENFFEPYNLQLLEIEKEIKNQKQKQNHEEIERRSYEAKKVVEGLSGPDSERFEQLRRDIDARHQSIDGNARRQEDLALVTGVNEGLLEIYSGAEDDPLMIDEGREVGRVLMAWQQKKEPLTAADRVSLSDFAGCYVSRAKSRTQQLSQRRLVPVSLSI